MEVRAVIGDVIQRDVPDMRDETILGEISGWDSLKMLNAVLLLERVLERQLSEAEIEGLNTVADLRRLLDSQ